MTQKGFASQIIQLIDNSRALDRISDKDLADELAMFMSTLQPKNRETFAKWGHEKDLSTPEDCWE